MAQPLPKPMAAAFLVLVILSISGVSQAGRLHLGLRGGRQLAQDAVGYRGVIITVLGNPWLLIGSSSNYKLIFGDFEPKKPLEAGMRVYVTGRKEGNQIFLTEAIQIESDGGSISEGMTPSVGGGGGGSSARHLSSDSEMSILVVPLNLCGEGVKFDAGSMRNLMVGKDNSVKSFFESCSWGKLSVPEDNVKIVDPVPVTGSGVCGGSQSPCDNFYSASTEAEDYLKRKGVDVASYKFRIYLFDSGQPNCRLYGRGLQGCSNYGFGCRAWLRLQSTGVPNLHQITHELGHNLGVHHSFRGADEYGDSTCPMGDASYGANCYNSLHASQLGWAQPKETLDASKMQPGEWETVEIIPRASSATSFISVKGVSNTGDLVISYLTPVGYDSDLSAFIHNKLAIYTPHERDEDMSDQLGTLSPGDRWESESRSPRLTVKLMDNASDSKAYVQLCVSRSSGDCSDPPKVLPVRGGSTEDVAAPPPTRAQSSAPPKRPPPRKN